MRAFITTRAAGSFATAGDEPVGPVMRRWYDLVAEAHSSGPRFVSSPQVHGSHVVVHAASDWEGWLRTPEADGHVASVRGTSLAVTVADCVPVFLAHPSGAVALLHSGWRGTAARITEQAIAAFGALGLRAAELRLHLGPAICGDCYEVSADVQASLTGRRDGAPAHVDLRSIIAQHAREGGVKAVTVSARCTKCDNDRFYSHRAGDAGRQVAVIVAEGS
ncbi:MAG: hypothetical protein NVS9B3_12140 [Gemmatimonadaceae bacterium]